MYEPKTYSLIYIKSFLSKFIKGLKKLIWLFFVFLSKEMIPFKPLPLKILIKKFSNTSPKWWPSRILLILNFLDSLINRPYLLSLATDWILLVGFRLLNYL